METDKLEVRRETEEEDRAQMTERERGKLVRENDTLGISGLCIRERRSLVRGAEARMTEDKRETEGRKIKRSTEK
jgi:hypothetical protein